MTPDLLHELLRLVDKEIEAIHDPYAWPPVRFEDLPADAQLEHRRLRATAASIAYRLGVAEYEEQEDRREHGALYPSHADWLDARRAEWAPVVATACAPTVLPSAPMAAKKAKAKPGRQGNPVDSPWRSPTAAMRKTPKFSTTVPADVQERLAELATEWGTGLGGVIARLVREHDERG